MTLLASARAIQPRHFCFDKATPSTGDDLGTLRTTLQQTCREKKYRPSMERLSLRRVHVDAAGPRSRKSFVGKKPLSHRKPPALRRLGNEIGGGGEH